MSLAETINSAPITNIPDLLNMHHSNPLGIPPLVTLIFIFVIALVMAYVNYTIRYKGVSQNYPVLYSLFSITFVAMLYYCFEGDLPTYMLQGASVPDIRIGWFVDSNIVGLGLSLIGVVALSIVLYIMLCAIMQITAQISFVGEMKDRKWKEWKGILVTVMVFALISGIGLALKYYLFAYWALIAMAGITILLVIIKAIRDWNRCKTPWYGIGGALAFFFAIIPIEILTVECLHGFVYFAVVIIALLSIAKARKKKASPEIK